MAGLPESLIVRLNITEWSYDREWRAKDEGITCPHCLSLHRSTAFVKVTDKCILSCSQVAPIVSPVSSCVATGDPMDIFDDSLYYSEFFMLCMSEDEHVYASMYTVEYLQRTLVGQPLNFEIMNLYVGVARGYSRDIRGNGYSK